MLARAYQKPLGLVGQGEHLNTLGKKMACSVLCTARMN